MNITPKRTLSYFLCFIGITFLLNLACSKDAETLRDVVLSEENSPVIKQDDSTNNPDIPQIEDSVVVETEIRTAILYPIHDAYIQNGEGYDEPIIRLEEEQRTSYLMFDFSPLDSIGGSISTATLMFVINTDDGSGEVDVYKGESSNWLETNLSEKTAPDVGELIGVTKQEYIIDTEVSIDLEVEALELEPYTFILDHKDGDDFAFASKENKTQAGSSLIVVYEVAVGADDIDLYIVEPEEVISDTDNPIEEEEGTNEVVRDEGDGSEEETPSNEEEEEVIDSVEGDTPISEEVAEENENTNTEEEVVAEEQEADSEEGTSSNEEEVIEEESTDNLEEDSEEVTPTTEESEPKTEEKETDIEEETPVTEVPEDNTDTNINPLPSIPFPTNESPVAVANGSPINGEVPLKVSFNAIDSSDDKAIVSYAWDFKDGQTASTANPEHTFDEAGNYEVTLLVKDEEGISALDVIIIKVAGPANTAPIAKLNADKTSGTLPLDVTFTGSQSTDDTGITEYSWDFKDGNSSDESDPSHTFGTAGTYEVSLTVTDAEGLKSTETVSIIVEAKENVAPVAKLSADKTSGTLPLAVSFTGSGSTDDTGITGYSWDFKDGNSSEESDPSHTFGTAGTYEVSLTVTDAEGLKSTETVSIIVEAKENIAPVAKLSADKTSGTLPLAVSFTGSGSTDDTGITGYSWDFKDGNSSEESDPSHTFGTAGTYAVALTVTDADGLKNTETVSVRVEEQESSPEEENVDPLPSTPFPTNESPVAVANGSPINGEAPLRVSFSALNSSDDKSIVSYTWDFKDGQTAKTVEVEHTFDKAGNYEVTLVTTDEEGISDLDIILITVTGPENVAPVAKLSADKTSGTLPLAVSFTGSGSTDDTGITGYSWDFKDGNSSEESDPSHTFGTAGTYEVSLTVTDAEGLKSTETVSIIVEAKENVAPVAKLSADKTSGTLPLAVSFTGSGSTDDTGITGYSWDFKDGNSSDESDPSHTFGTAGTYEVSLTVTDAEGLKSTETVSIIVEAKENVAPVAKLSADKTSGTLPLAVSFTGSGSTDDTGITGYSWDFKDGNSSDESDPSHTFGTAGTYEVSLTVTDAEGLKSTETVSIIVEAKENVAPVAKLSADKTSGTLPLAVSFTGSGSTDDTGITGYSWNFKDGNSSDESDPSHTFGTAGTYEVSLTVTDAEGLKSTETVSIIVEAKENVAPVAKLSADKTSGTLPLAVSFTGSGSTDDTGITGYSWDFKDGNSSDESDPSHTFGTAGTYEVSLTVTDAEGLKSTETVSIIVEAKENVAPVAKLSADKTSGTLPLAVSFTGSGSTDDTGITGYSWNFKDGNGSEQSDATHTFETAGIYEVSLTVTDEEGLTSTSSLSINVIEAEVVGPLDCSTGGKTAGESGNKVWCWGDIAFPTWSGSSGVSFSDKQLYIDSQCDEQQVTKSGNRLKFSVNPNSPNVANWCSEDYNIRAEVRTEPWNVRHPKGTEEWFGWSYSFGNNYVIDENNEWLFFQVHPGISGKSPHTELMVNREGQYGGKAGEIYIVNHVNYPDYIATGIIPKAGETIDVVVHAIWGDSSNGLLEVWINGQKFYNKQTKTIYDSHPWGGNAKWGIYKWPWRDGDKVQKSVEQGASQLETYLGTVRMITRKPGDTDYGKDSYSMVAPN